LLDLIKLLDYLSIRLDNKLVQFQSQNLIRLAYLKGIKPNRSM